MIVSIRETGNIQCHVGNQSHLLICDTTFTHNHQRTGTQLVWYMNMKNSARWIRIQIYRIHRIYDNRCGIVLHSVVFETPFRQRVINDPFHGIFGDIGHFTVQCAVPLYFERISACKRRVKGTSGHV